MESSETRKYPLGRESTQEESEGKEDEASVSFPQWMLEKELFKAFKVLAEASVDAWRLLMLISGQRAVVI